MLKKASLPVNKKFMTDKNGKAVSVGYVLASPFLSNK
jgi:hypothetical protein